MDQPGFSIRVGGEIDGELTELEDALTALAYLRQALPQRGLPQKTCTATSAMAMANSEPAAALIN